MHSPLLDIEINFKINHLFKSNECFMILDVYDETRMFMLEPMN